MIIVFRAPALTQSGYGVHSRMFLRFLKEIYPSDKHTVILQATPWGQTPFILRDFPEKEIADEYIKNSAKVNLAETKPDLSFQLILPNEWDPNLANKNVGITAAVETDRLNPKWVEFCNNMDLVLVPSSHVKRSFENSGLLTTPLEVLHEIYDERIYNADLKFALDLPEIDSDFNFLLLGQFAGSNMESDRKNIMPTIKVFLDAFAGREDVGLVIKTNAGGNSLIDKNICYDRIAKFIKDYRKSEFPKIHLIHGSMDDEEIAQLYIHPKIKCLVSLTRGEGFALPVLEAAVSGLPVAITNWSGHLDILNSAEKAFTPLEYFMSPVKFVDGNIFIENSYWAEVDQENATRKLQRVVESYSWCKNGADKLKKVVKGKFSFGTVKNKLVDLIKDNVCEV